MMYRVYLRNSSESTSMRCEPPPAPSRMTAFRTPMTAESGIPTSAASQLSPRMTYPYAFEPPMSR